jgi:hypothetical protein
MPKSNVKAQEKAADAQEAAGAEVRHRMKISFEQALLLFQMCADTT